MERSGREWRYTVLKSMKQWDEPLSSKVFKEMDIGVETDKGRYKASELG